MATKLLTQFFQDWWKTSTCVPDLENTSITPPLHNQKLPSQRQINLADLVDQDDINFLLLGCLPGQGFYKLKLSDVSHDPNSSDFKDLQYYLSHLPGVVSVVGQHHINTFDFVLDFSTAEEAAMAFATNPTINLGSGVQRAFQYADTDPSDPDFEPSRKRMKVADNPEADITPPSPRCQICCEEIKGSFVRPCLHCKKPWCYDCVTSNFETVMTDPDRFPARCCAKVMHWDVSRGVLNTEGYDKYKSRFEEFSTTKPVYCANKRCSIFLPFRLSQPDERGHINCPECSTMTCKECRTVVSDTDTHECASVSETASFMTKFDYKTCPRCKIAVARMFGCSHMRCRCGAHFCWECLRPINICWGNPCDGSREEDGDDYYQYREEDDPVDESENNPDSMRIPAPAEAVSDSAPNTLQVLLQAIEVAHPNLQADTHLHVPQGQPVTHADTPTLAMEPEEPSDLLHLFDAAVHVPEPTHFETPPDAPPHTPVVEPVVDLNIPIVSDVNLDDARRVWQTEAYDFGDEPYEESWDTWGCVHAFNIVSARACKEWLPTITSISSGRHEKHADCMRCFKTIVFDEKTEVLKEDEDNNADKTSQAQAAGALGANPVNHDLSIPLNNNNTGSLVEIAATRNKKKKNKKPSEVPKLFSCIKCGIFHCVDCRNFVIKELNKQLES